MIKKNLFQFYSKKNKYTNLFISLLAIFVLSPFVKYFWLADIIISFTFFLTVLFSINTVSASPKLIFICRSLATFILITDLTFLVNLVANNYGDYASKIYSVIGNVCFSIFILIAITAISSRVIQEKKVNQDVIKGSICIYLMLGVLWFSLYQIIALFDDNAFQFFDNNPNIIESQLFYFSFVTLTTLGYGDITPVNGFAMMLSNLQGLVGQLFPAIVIAKLVSAYQDENEETDEN